MAFYSHPNKILEQHLENVKDIALIHLHKYVMPHYPIEFIVSNIAKLHDLGKYTSFFQDFITGKDKSNKPEKNHSRLGAYAALNKLYANLDLAEDEKKFLSSLAMLSILWHHQNLQSPLNSELYQGINKSAKAIFDLQKKDLQIKIKQIPLLEENFDYLFIPDKKKIGKFWHNFKKQTPEQPDKYFLFNYIFSLLIEADKLDASETEVYKKKNIKNSLVEDFIINLNRNELSQIRNQARNSVISQYNKIDVHKERIFTLTAPTGIGKTLTVLDFALKLRERINKERKYIPHIIYALPFVNIIEQNMSVYEAVLGENAKILAHYQLADVFSNKTDIENEIDIKSYDKLKMQLDTWQADIVITTFVQFFKTLITGKNKLLKKFNHYAGSIIILDEIQTMPLDMLPLIGSMLYFLAKYLDAYIIVMTATQPGLFKLAEREFVIHQIKKRELLFDNQRFFDYFHRTRIYPLIDTIIKDTHEFIPIFEKYWSSDKSSLIVCNTVRRSIEIYKLIKEKYPNALVYYLSTNILPIERKKRVEEIKQKLEKGDKLILVSTQVVEAGVDLDFDMAFRDIGPIDAIVQIAGRVNREDKKENYSPVYIVNFEKDAERIYGIVTVQQAQIALSKYQYVDENMYKNLVEDYFYSLADKTSFDEYKKLYENIKKLNYNKIEKFAVIKDKNVVSIFIEFDEIATEVLGAYKDMLNGKLSKSLFELKYKLPFNQRILSIPFYLENLNELPILDEGIRVVPKHLLSSYYNPDTGFRRSRLAEQVTFL